MDRAVDILHPLASLEWRQCQGPPIGVGAAQAVWLNDKVYVGGGEAFIGSRRDDARLYIYTPATDTWSTLDTPVCEFALTTYHSQLVLVGGREYMYVGENIGGLATNKLWTLSEDGQWQETLPPTPTLCGTKASALSHGDHLLVIGYGHPNNKVYVYNGHHWSSAQHPPLRLALLKSNIVNGHCYLMGSDSPGSMVALQRTCVYSASLDSLLASCQPSETSQPSSIWKRLPDVPSGYCYPVVFGNRLVAVGRGSPPTPISLHVYSSFTQSWVHIGDAPVSSSSFYPCAIVLPSNELMVVRGWTAFKFTLKLAHFNPESPFNLRVLSLLEAAAGIPVRRTLNSYTWRIQIFLGLARFTKKVNLNSLLNYWISNVQWLPPTWKCLLLIIRLFDLDDLAQRMETYLKGGAEEPHESPVVEETEKEGGEVESQLQLREQTIYRLKQEMASLREEKDTTIFTLEEKIKELLSEIVECRTRLPSAQIKTEVEEKSVSLHPVKIEPEEEPHILEGELLALSPVKIEVKEEATTMPKAETTSAQPTTDVSSHSITAIVCGASYMSTATWNLPGVEVCGEMTVVVYSSHDQQITWPGYGLRLHIPKGCLPVGMEQCTINIKASLSGQYEFPENSHLVSAVFWLRCEDVFTRPITVEIQHCAKSENVNNLEQKFVRAICSQKQLLYTFKQLPGGNFTSHSSYGVIELNTFSGVGVTQEGSEDREYCSQLFYLGQPNLCKIHFVVTWNIDAHLSEVIRKYEKEGAILGLHQPVEFESDAITLDIPMEGITIKGWKITPLIRPVVTKKQVDNFREGKLTPCCQLKAQVVGRRKKIPYMSHQVALQGAKYPHNVFTIDLPAEDPNSQPALTFGDLATADLQGPPPKKRSRLEDTESCTGGAPTAGPSSDTGLDTKLNLSADHYKVVSYLRKLDDRRIRYVGGALGLAYNTLDKMKDIPSEVAAAWLRGEDYVMTASGEPTWRTLTNALRKEGQEGTARDIEEAEK